MKKWLSVIGSALLGVLTYAFMGICAIKMVSTLTSSENSYNGYQLMKDADLKTLADGIDSAALGIYKVFAIILLVMAGLAIVYAIVKTLSNLGVFKLPKVVDYVFIGIAVVAVISAIIAIIAALNFRADILAYYKSLFGSSVSNYIKLPIYPGLVLVLLETILTSVAAVLGIFGKKKA